MACGLTDTGHKEPVVTGLDRNKEGESAQEQEKEIDKVSEEKPKRRMFSFLFEIFLVIFTI